MAVDLTQFNTLLDEYVDKESTRRALLAQLSKLNVARRKILNQLEALDAENYDSSPLYDMIKAEVDAKIAASENP